MPFTIDMNASTKDFLNSYIDFIPSTPMTLTSVGYEAIMAAPPRLSIAFGKCSRKAYSEARQRSPRASIAIVLTSVQKELSPRTKNRISMH